MLILNLGETGETGSYRFPTRAVETIQQKPLASPEMLTEFI